MSTRSDHASKTRDVAPRPAPGADADRPTEIPPKGWLQVLKRGWAEAKADQVPLLAAGVAFFGFLSLFPGLVAMVLVYGLVVDPVTVSQHIGAVTTSLPPGAGDLIADQLKALTATPQKSLGFGLIISILAALWSASGGVGQLMTAVNTAYDEDESRGFVSKKLLALVMTLGAIVFMVIVILLVAVAPPVLDNLIGTGVIRWLFEAIRWVVLVILVAVALAVLYRVAPQRDSPKMRWVSTGAIIGTVLWVIASIGFTVYVANFGSYAKTYGALAGVVVLLLWLWITCYAVLLGAEINAESEEQTAADTTRGPAEPLGQRGAVKADSTPPKA